MNALDKVNFAINFALENEEPSRVYSNAFAALPELVLRPQPQPISTAPKDGTTILGWLGTDWTAVEFVFGDWQLAYVGSYASDSRCTPTYWLPQPGAPT